MACYASDENVTLINAIFLALNKRDLRTLIALFDEKIVFDFPGVGQIQGKKRVTTFFTLLFRQYPLLEFTVQKVIADSDNACAVWDNKGLYKNGNAYQNSGVTIVYFSKEKKIILLSDFFKDTSFTQSSFNL